MSKKRISCPYCRELILPKAKKCRYCKENLNQKSNKSFRFLYLRWSLSMLIFFIFLFATRRMDLSQELGIVAIGLFIVVIFGGMAFYLMLVSKILGHLKTKNAKIYGLISLATIFAFFGLLINFDSVEAKLGFDPPEFKNSTQKVNLISSPTTTPSSTPVSTTKTTKTSVQKNATSPNNSNQVECIGPDGKKFTTSMDDCKSLNEKWGKTVDYMTNCNIHSNCGGGVEYMPKSQCDKPCSGHQTTNTAPVITTQNKPSGSADYYCFNNVTKFSYYTTSGEQCNADNTESICLNGVKVLEYNPCMDKCLENTKDDTIYCTYSLSGSAMESCLDEKVKTFRTCNDACGEISRIESEKCY